MKQTKKISKRKSISKKIRFEVFKRDGFRCAYCGNTPPEVILEIDHIIPVSKKGTNDINNLITSCFDCNRGKGKIELDKVPPKIAENIEILKEKEEQVMQLRKYIKTIERRINRDVIEIENVFKIYFENREFTERFRKGTIKYFLKHLPVHEIIEAEHIAFNKVGNPNDAIKYFCGICWNKIKGTKAPFDKGGA